MHLREKKHMKIYKNPYVSRPCYFVVTNKVRSAKTEMSMRNGYNVCLLDGKWEIYKGQMYDDAFNEMPLVYEDKKFIGRIMLEALKTFVIDAVANDRKEGDEE